MYIMNRVKFAYMRNVRRFFSADATKNVTVPEDKSTMIEKWTLYWKNLYIDYKTVALDVKKESIEKPFKTAIILSGLAFACYCGKNNPDENNYRDSVLRSMSDLILVDPSSHRKSSANHIEYVTSNYNTHQIRRLNLLVFSLMYTDHCSSECNTYKCLCKYSKHSLAEFKDKIIDIGFLNKWWILSERMENYDINY